MNLFQRIRTTVKADAHGIIDSVEDKGLLLKQYLREAREALDDSRTRLGNVDEEIDANKTILDGLRITLDEADRDIGLAVNKEEQELARFATAKFLRSKNEIAMREKSIELLLEKKEELRAEVLSHEGQLQELELRIGEFLRVQAHRSGLGKDSPRITTITPEDIEMELLRRSAN